MRPSSYSVAVGLAAVTKAGHTPVNLTLPAVAPSMYLCGYRGPDLKPLAGLERLARLEVGPARSLAALTGIEALTTLEWLGIYHAPKLRDLGSLASRMETLTHLRLDTCKSVDDLPLIERLAEGAEVVIDNCRGLDGFVSRT